MLGKPLRLIWVMMLLVPACGVEEAPVDYDWDRSASTVVASYGSAGGFVPAMLGFRESLYGSPFVRLTGDGTLYHGTPTRVKVRKLSEREMQQLMAGVRPDLFGSYSQHYNASLATDMPTTTVAVHVHEWGQHEVGIYGLEGSSSQELGAVPEKLLLGARALRAAGTGGVDHAPTRLRLGALRINLAPYAKVDPAKVKEWPVSGVDLSKAEIYGPPSKGLVLSNAVQVKQILGLLSGGEDLLWADSSVVFRQGGEHFWVTYIVMLP